MELKLINGKWLLVSENGETEAFFELSEINKKLFDVLFRTEMILSKYNIKLKTEPKEESLLSELIGITKELIFGLAEIITKRESIFRDEFDYEIYENKHWNK